MTAGFRSMGTTALIAGGTSVKQVTETDLTGGHIGLDVSLGNQGNPTGIWGYVSATLTSGSLTGVGKCIGIRVFGAGVDGTFNINGGNTITVRNGAGVDINPGGNVTAPVVNWISGTLDVIIEGLS